VAAFAVFVVFTSTSEMDSADAADSVGDLYTTAKVCASQTATHDNADVSWVTYDIEAEASAAGKKVAHCGKCGACSTAKDIQIYADANGTLGESLTDSMKKCALFYFLPTASQVWPFDVSVGGRTALAKCIDNDIGFTAACRDAWVDKLECSARNCAATCIRSSVLMEPNNTNNRTATIHTAIESTGYLNDCLACDEKMCSREFLDDAGVNPRRAGILNDIDRPVGEVCTKVDSSLTWQPGA